MASILRRHGDLWVLSEIDWSEKYETWYPYQSLDTKSFPTLELLTTSIKTFKSSNC